MGSYTDFKVGEYVLLETKGDVVPELMTLFREMDRVTVPGHENEEGDRYDTYLYRTTVRVAKERLGVLGFSLRKTEADFLTCKADEISRLKEWSEDSDSDHFGEQLKLLEGADFAAFQEGFRLVKAKNLRASLFGEKTAPNESDFVQFMLEPEDDGALFHFPCSDMRHLLRAFIEVSGDDEAVSQDISDLIHGGYYESNDRVTELAISRLTQDYPINSKIIVLTEGSTDKLILESAIDLLYPHLAEYYSFMDFSSANASGGTGALISNIRAFAGSGIRNRVVAVFDNDTAGQDAERTLKRTALPANIKVLRYPDAAVAACYPTLGPTGMVSLDVNGLAASIELFLGRDVLTANNEMTPIQWTGYNAAVGRYQGEILNKAQLQNRYFQKIEACKQDRSLISEHDFADMRLLLDTLFQVFQ